MRHFATDILTPLCFFSLKMVSRRSPVFFFPPTLTKEKTLQRVHGVGSFQSNQIGKYTHLNKSHYLPYHSLRPLFIEGLKKGGQLSPPKLKTLWIWRVLPMAGRMQKGKYTGEGHRTMRRQPSIERSKTFAPPCFPSTHVWVETSANR